MLLLAQAAEAAAGPNTAEIVLFWVFAVLALGAALAVITMRNIVHGALMLVLNLLAIAGLYLTLESSFLGVIQILVYAGAIVVLFLFVVMILGVDRDDLLLAGRGRNQIAAVLGGVLLASALLFAFVGPYTGPPSVCGSDAPIEVGSGQQRCVGLADQLAEDDGSGAAFLGERMFTRYTYAFELSALLLTVATIGAVILARRKDLEIEDLDQEPDGGGVPGPDGLGPHDHDPLAAIGADLAGQDHDPADVVDTDPDDQTPTDEREG
ncbi:MAG: NADH-quinone oxidoreductase subunit J [Nitriliruptor sp.]|nr:MAG: NADH-quinone oxidoreductase subunit J [Nitriliruptor sp.]